MMENIVLDDQIEAAFRNTNFGCCNNKEVIADSLIKCAAGYRTGATAMRIVRELRLVQGSRWKLTTKGELYLYEVFAALKAENEALKKTVKELQEWHDSHL